MRISDWSSDVCSSDLVEIRQHLALGHQRHDVVDVRVRIDVMQTHPRAEFRQPFAKPEHARLVFAVAPLALRVLEIGAVGRGRSEEHTSELQSLMRISYAVFCL